jgi:hypothetical protein
MFVGKPDTYYLRRLHSRRNEEASWSMLTRYKKAKGRIWGILVFDMQSYHLRISTRKRFASTRKSRVKRDFEEDPEEGEVKQTKESAEVNDAQFLMGSFQTGKHCVPKQNDTYHACLKSRARKNRLCSCIDFKEQI